MNTPTPETDAMATTMFPDGSRWVQIEDCRKLERERDDLKNAISGLCEHFKIHAGNATFLAVEILAIERQRNEWKQKYTQQNKDLGCEQMDPDGTIWDYAKKVQTDLSAMTEQRDKMAEILRDILAYNKGEKPHDYWALPHDTVTNMMAFDAWQEILRKIEEALETKP